MPMRQVREGSPSQRRIAEALEVLAELGLPTEQRNDRSALTLLALLGLTPDMPWSAARASLLGITPMMAFFDRHYGWHYAANTRETVRRQTIHQFLDAGLILLNPDQPERPINSPRTVYQIESSALSLLRSFGTAAWAGNVARYRQEVGTLQARYAQERRAARLVVPIDSETLITLSPGGQNVLIEKVIAHFAPRFAPGGKIVYGGDTDEKFAHFDREALAALGIALDPHGKMPDVIIYRPEQNWLLLIEAVTSHGPIDPKRRAELQRLFGASRAGLIFVTAFLTRKAMTGHIGNISWETEVWIAEAPDHLIHFDGNRFLGPYPG